MTLRNKWWSNRPQIRTVDPETARTELEAITRCVEFLPADSETEPDVTVALVDGKIVGRLISTLDNGEAIVHAVDVDQEMRGKGLGRRLVKSFLESVRLQGATSATVGSNCNEGFWALQGFRPVNTVDRKPLLHRHSNPRGRSTMVRMVPPIIPANPFR